MNEFQVQKRNGGAVHTGYEHAGFISSGCGAGHSHNQGLDNVTRTWVKVDAAVTCKRCLKNLATQQPEQAPEIKPGRCLQRVAKVGKTPTQCIKGHAHEDDHEDRYGQTFANHAIVPGAEPLSPTAQALADAGHAQDEAAREYREAKTPAQRAAAEQKYEDAEALRQKANEAHHAAREEAGDFLPRHDREAQQPKAAPRTPKATKVRKATEAELWKEEREAAEPKPAPFTFEYDATAGILIAAALREKAKTHRDAAKGYRTNAGLGTQLQDFYIELARIQDNNAQLLEDAADAIHGPVKTALAEDMGRAIDRADKSFHGQVKDAIGLKW